LPILGPWPGHRGTLRGDRALSQRILLAPITAQIMTEWMTHGTPTLDVKDFLPQRLVKDHQT
jgi:hypothetical protein